MSTGHRPTYFPAIGQASIAGAMTSAQVSVKDQLSQKTMKYRQVGQSSQSEQLAKDYRSELEANEQTQLAEKEKTSTVTSYLTSGSSSTTQTLEKTKDAPRLLTNAPVIDANMLRKKYDDADASGGGESDKDLESSDDEEDDDDEDDEELELQRELARIKAERAAAQAKKEQEERLREEQLQTESAMRGNPLVALTGDDSAKVKRRWNDDVVFRNQTRDEPEHKKRFINDTIRNDFHRSFLKKFMK